MVTGGGYRKGWGGWFIILVSDIFLRGYYFQYTKFQSLSDKESVVESAISPFHPSERRKSSKDRQTSDKIHSLARWALDAG